MNGTNPFPPAGFKTVLQNTVLAPVTQWVLNQNVELENLKHPLTRAAYINKIITIQTPADGIIQYDIGTLSAMSDMQLQLAYTQSVWAFTQLVENFANKPEEPASAAVTAEDGGRWSFPDRWWAGDGDSVSVLKGF